MRNVVPVSDFVPNCLYSPIHTNLLIYGYKFNPLDVTPASRILRIYGCHLCLYNTRQSVAVQRDGASPLAKKITHYSTPEMHF